MADCTHCGDRYGATPAVARVTWSVGGRYDGEASAYEVALCQDHVDDLRRTATARHADVFGVQTHPLHEESEL